MSKAVEQLNAKGLHNEHGIASLVFFHYRAQDSRRGGHGAAWVVVHKKKKYAGAWYDYGHKVFAVFRKTKAETFQDALRFAASECRKKKWARSPFGGFVPVDDLIALGLKVPKAKIITPESHP